MSLPCFTISDWSAGKYGSEKSTSFLRSGVIVAAEATMSNLPCARSRKIVSNGVFWKVALDAEPLRDLVDDVDVEPLVGRLAELERRVGDVRADREVAALTVALAVCCRCCRRHIPRSARARSARTSTQQRDLASQSAH